jgi:hypothetical protein
MMQSPLLSTLYVATRAAFARTSTVTHKRFGTSSPLLATGLANPFSQKDTKITKTNLFFLFASLDRPCRSLWPL